MTKGVWATHMDKPKTIHDFGGFPKALFDIQYPAKGSPLLAEDLTKNISTPKIQLDENWGLDHGTWTVIKHMYPQANIPIIQLSLDLSEPPEFHFELGKKLNFLRSKGVMIVGSGNIVHNLRTIKWEENSTPYDWAQEFDEVVKKDLLNRDFKKLLNSFHNTQAGKLSVPTTDHYYPLFYILGAASIHDELKFNYEGFELGSISLRTLTFS
jgi:4,5-DOPA dioxygenase extradiol